MKQPPRLAPALLFLLACTLSGCQGLTEFLDESSVAEKAFWTGAALGGAAPVVALAPITIPLANAADGREGLAYFLIPGVPTGLIGGVALGLPVLALETIVRLPRRVWNHVQARDPEPAREVPPPEPDWAPQPESPDEGDSLYQQWPEQQSVPR